MEDRRREFGSIRESAREFNIKEADWGVDLIPSLFQLRMEFYDPLDLCSNGPISVWKSSVSSLSNPSGIMRLPQE